MIEETAVVSKIVANQVWVRAGRSSSCGKCSQNTLCSTQLLEKYIAKREIAVETELLLEQGDKIILAIDESQLVIGSLLIYILPLIALFLGALFGESIANFWPAFNPDIVVSITAITGFVLVLLLLNKGQTTLLIQQFAKPVVVRKL